MQGIYSKATILRSPNQGLAPRRRTRSMPLPGNTPPKLKYTSQFEWLTPSTFDDLVACAPTHLVLQLHMLVGTGMRPSEMFELKWNELDFETDLIQIGDNKLIAMRPHIRIVLERITRSANEHVILTGDGKPYALRGNAGGQSKSAVRRMRDLAGYPQFQLSHAEHTYAVWHWALYRDWVRLKEESGWTNQKLRWCRKIPHPALDDIRDQLLALYADPPAGIWSAGLFASPEKDASALSPGPSGGRA